MSAQTQDISLLYVEDDEIVRESMLEFLNRRFDTVLSAENGEDGLDIYRDKLPDIVMTDIRMPIMDGLEMTRAILELNDKANIIMTSAYNESNYLLAALELGISHYLLKPLDRDKVDASLRHCVETVRKVRSLCDRENSIAEAYRTINSLIDYGEKSVNSSISLCTQMERQLNQMVESILKGSSGMVSHSPASVIMTLTHGLAGRPEWFWYEMEPCGPVQKACYLDPPPVDLVTPVGSHALYYLNDGDQLPEDPLLRCFLEHFERCGERPRNLVWYRYGSRIICALNYPSDVTVCDAAVVKGLAVQARYLDNISAQHQQTEEAFLYTITSLARAAEVNDEDTGNHIRRVGEYCTAICRSLGYSDELAEIIALQSHLHDVGKIHIPPDLLNKAGKLTDEEMALMREHTIYGAKIIGGHPRLEIARTIALHHHECWDGSGYPHGLRGIGIPLDARIVTIADTYDALRNKRSYKPAFDHDSAYRIIVEGDGRTEPYHFDPDLLAVFKRINKTFDDIYNRLATLE